MGYISFYKLNLEAELMSSGLPYTIIKPCGLVDDAPEQHEELVVGHDDNETWPKPIIARADVARVIVASLESPTVSSGLRFDLCSKAGPATPDSALPALLKAAQYPWEKADSSPTSTV